VLAGKRKRMPDEENERGKTAKNIFRCKRELFCSFKAINVGNVVLVNKEKLASQNTTVRLCRYMRSL
jgi:hypothetical protein